MNTTGHPSATAGEPSIPIAPPVVARMGRPARPATDRFWPKVRQDGDCWVWTGALDRDGYGHIKDGRTVGVHRWAYQQMVGPIPDGLQLDHLCRNRACVNPYHLDPVPGAVNTKRGKWASLTHCVNGHPYDEANTIHRPTGGRACRPCRRDATARYRARRLEALVAEYESAA